MKISWLIGLLALICLFNEAWSSNSCSTTSDCGGSDIKHLICSEGTCSSCSNNNECNNGGICDDGYCTLNGLFSPFTIRDILTALAILTGSIVAAGGGLGGGGIFVPVFILIIGLQTKSAAALSQATIFGGSIVNLIMNFRENHPIREHRPLPDLPTILIFEPMLLGGTIIGVILNVMFPDPIILALLIVILTYATIRTTKKGIRMWKKESDSLKHGERIKTYSSLPNIERPKKRRRGKKQFESDINDLTMELFPMDDDDDQKSDILNTKNNTNNTTKVRTLKTKTTDINEEGESGSDSDVSTSSSFSDDNGRLGLKTNKIGYGSTKTTTTALKGGDMTNNSKIETENWIDIARACGLQPADMTKQFISNLKPYIKQEKQVIKPMLIVLLIWIIVSSFSIFRGTSIFGVKSCSSEWWGLTFGVFPFLFLITFLIAYREVRNYSNKIQLGWEPANGDIEWNFQRAISYPTIAGIAGILGGLLGIGGGMIVSPLLLELGVLPRVAAATSALAVMVTSSSATLQFVLLGMLKLDYMLFFMGVGIIGTFIGQTAVNHCVKKYGRASVVVFAVAAVIGLAVILMGIDGIIDIVNGDTSMVFDAPC